MGDIREYPAAHYGAKLKNRYSKKIIRCTTPCNKVVLPIVRVSAPIKNDRNISVILRLLMPRLKGKLKKIAIVATVGMVNPILAKAEPSAKLRLLWRRFALAALIECSPLALIPAGCRSGVVQLGLEIG